MEYNEKKKRNKQTQCCGCTCSRLVVSFLLLLLLLIAAIVAIIAILALKLQPKPVSGAKARTGTSTCVTESCVLAAASILKDVNLTVNPCDNFIQYSCGKWLQNTDIPPSLPQFHRRFEMKERLTVEINDLISKPIRNSDPEAVRKAKQWYKSCTNVKSIRESGKQPLLDIVKDLGGWPIIDDGWSSSSSLEKSIAKSYHFGQAPFLHVHTLADFDDPYKAMLHIGQPSEGPEFFLDSRTSTNIVAYEDYIAAVVAEFGIPRNDAKQKARDLVDFEIRLANIMNSKADLYVEKISKLRLSVRELYSNISQDFDWEIFLNALLEPVNIKINTSDIVVIQGANYFEKLSEIIRSTPQSVLQNLIVWKTLKPLLEHLPLDGIEDATDTYKKNALGIEASKNRWETCVKQVKFDETYAAKDYGLALSRLWLPKHFDSSSKEIIIKMVENLREGMISVLKEADWLEKETREYAIEKARAVTLQLGYPDWLYDDKKLDSYYSVFKTEEEQYVKNLAFMFGGGILANLRKLKEKPGPDVWPADFPPTDADAGFLPEVNMFVYPAGILQPPYFHKDYPAEMNYGAMGLVIGHEFTHGFDTYGRHYDKHGYKKNWWTESDAKQFEDRSKCISDQYSSFVIPEAPGEHINGAFTIGEDIADNGGLKVAFRAYNIYLEKEQSKPQSLPGLNLSHHQLFFLSAARAFCGKIRKDYYKEFLQNDNHSPEIYRIKGITENSKEFSSAFSCSPTSPQNPARKCAVW